jgi:aquaporin related protein
VTTMRFFSTFRIDLYAAFLEFVGTTTFLLLGLGGIQAAADSAAVSINTPVLEKDLYIATSMGLALVASAWIFYRVTGGLFNPNISLALLLVGVIGPVRFVLYCIAQMTGAIAASAIILALTPGPVEFKFGDFFFI